MHRSLYSVEHSHEYADTIRPGDMLTAVSGATGVPIGILVEVSKLIHAGASLLIPPVR